MGMDRGHSRPDGRVVAPIGAALLGAALLGALLGGCGGGGGGTELDSGADKTTLSVEAADADGDALSYQWRVTAGSIDNRNARETVWTMPAGPGLHFAYVTVSDGKGGYVEQQYAVGTDTLGIAAEVRPPLSPVVLPIADFAGSATRLRFVASDDTRFAPPSGGVA
ncbi:MAG TPA: hypothetical protein VF319_19140, partial [Caldimonas sp.]